MERRVVITGMGTVNSLGKSVKETWNNAVNGVTGVGPITLFDPVKLDIKIAAEVKDFNPADSMSPKLARRLDRFQQFALVAFEEALLHSSLDIQASDPTRIAVIISSAVGGLKAIEDLVMTIHESGPRKVSPFQIPMIMADGAAGTISIENGIMGPCFSVASACASGTDAIGQAMLFIQAGIVDAVIAGGSDATINQTGIGAFQRTGAISYRNDPEVTPSPFDRDRDGMVMGEGAAIMIVESLEHAQARGAEILAELIGYGSTVDAFHITAPREDGAGGARAMRQAMEMSGLISPEDIDYVNTHGTGTVLNDVSETRAIKGALGKHAYKIPVSSTKSMTGHMIGATGALEAIFSIQSILKDVVPPTIHLKNPDPECDLDYVPNEARKHDVEVALNNSFGFGGHNAVLAFKSFSG